MRNPRESIQLTTRHASNCPFSNAPVNQPQRTTCNSVDDFQTTSAIAPTLEVYILIPGGTKTVNDDTTLHYLRPRICDRINIMDRKVGTT